jgi:flagellar biosynthesis chaperone FliJ
MSVLVNTKNEQEEKVLLAFLDSLRYNYQAGVDKNEDELNNAFIDQYNSEIEQADAAIEAGSFVSHEDVEQLFKNRRKAV